MKVAPPQVSLLEYETLRRAAKLLTIIASRFQKWAEQILSPKGTAEDALNDMKKEAANKGANYLQIKEYSSYGTAVTGIAFKCP